MQKVLNFKKRLFKIQACDDNFKGGKPPSALFARCIEHREIAAQRKAYDAP
jgi:hypothetical protein